jgi:hypothetical protein
MKHTKEQIKEIIKRLLVDIKRPYYTSKEFEIEFDKSIKPLFVNKNIANAWEVTVYVQEDQFRDKDEYGYIIIVINDDTGSIESYADLSCGRPVPSKARLNSEGKYELVQL